MLNVALGFAKLTDPTNNAASLVIEAAAAHPFWIAGTGRFYTKIMQTVTRQFIKFGAEGVFCGCIPHAGLGFALKCDDGAMRGAEVSIANVLAKLDVWTDSERETIQSFTHEDMSNWRKISVGEIHAK
jgi:L-asparaginase II